MRFSLLGVNVHGCLDIALLLVELQNLTFSTLENFCISGKPEGLHRSLGFYDGKSLSAKVCLQKPVGKKFNFGIVIWQTLWIFKDTETPLLPPMLVTTLVTYCRSTSWEDLHLVTRFL